MEQEIIHIPELAKLLGRSESSIRSARQAGAYWLPPYFKQGSRICWRLSTVRRFLQECEEGRHTPARPGRKRQPLPTLARVS
jgi:predicted DNA-binding transcriptional regulator AlpA